MLRNHSKQMEQMMDIKETALFIIPTRVQNEHFEWRKYHLIPQARNMGLTG